jgi:predicted O-methyltransferase YrrM
VVEHIMVGQLLPSVRSVLSDLRAWGGEQLNTVRLSRQPRRDVDFSALPRLDQIDLTRILDPDIYREDWLSAQRDVEALLGGHNNLAFSANPGDQRALYQFIRCLRPRNVLEIGTCCGVSALYIAMAMRCNRQSEVGEPHRLVTVDIADANDPKGHWAGLKLPLSPRDMVNKSGLGDFVQFVTSGSSSYFATTLDRFDFVYLDGSTAAANVYRDLQDVPSVLRGNALILLHVYFPEGRPLWEGQSPINGPWRAVERLGSEGGRVAARPLGTLPWTTKNGSTKTSLALIGRTHQA